jgi:hydroxyacyl-ACP dehydratase HTD2-like protein with hotdog domain
MSTTVLTAGAELPPVVRTPGAADLFMFSASAWLIHRIHYDLPFATDHDGHPGLLIHGPLQGVYLVQSAQRWLGREASLSSIRYRHHAPAYLGDTLTCGGSVTQVAADGSTVELELWLKNGADTTTTTGVAVFSLPATEA